MRTRWWLIICLLLVACHAPGPLELVVKLTPVAEEPEAARYYLKAQDFTSTVAPIERRDKLALVADRGYAFRLPVAPWGECVLLDIFCTGEYSLSCANYERGAWHPYIELPRHSYRIPAYALDWAVGAESSADLTVYMEYPAPENYVYCTIETLVCQNIGAGEPFCVTFWGSNLWGGQHGYVYFSFWSEAQGWGGCYAVDHPDMPNAVYDVGIRRQGLSDEIDTTIDGVWAVIDGDKTLFQQSLRTATYTMIQSAKAGYREQLGSHDYLRDYPWEPPVPTATYALGMVVAKPTKSFAGHSGALFNTTLTIEEPGNYMLWYIVADGHRTCFYQNDVMIDVVTGPPVYFRVEESAG